MKSFAIYLNDVGTDVFYPNKNESWEEMYERILFIHSDDYMKTFMIAVEIDNDQPIVHEVFISEREDQLDYLT